MLIESKNANHFEALLSEGLNLHQTNIGTMVEIVVNKTIALFQDGRQGEANG